MPGSTGIYTGSDTFVYETSRGSRVQSSPPVLGLVLVFRDFYIKVEWYFAIILFREFEIVGRGRGGEDRSERVFGARIDRGMT